MSAISEGQVIDASSEVEIGQAIVQQALERFGRYDNPALDERLNKILKRLAVVSDRPERELRYQVVLIDVPIVNALTVPGGTVLVFKGLIDLVDKRLGGTDDAWAAVLGHECSHAALRHGAGMIHVASSLMGGKALMGQVELAGLLNTVSRVHEFEADQFGVLYAYRAGFNPVASLALHEAMLANNGEIPRGMTHPTHKERIERMRDYLLDLRGKVRGFDLAVRALDNGDYDAAKQRLEVFLGVFPDSTSARSNLGVAMHRKALLALQPGTRYRRATDVDPNARVKKVELRASGASVAGLRDMPKADERMLKAAVAEYESALSVDAGYPQALTNLGAALVDLHDKKRALGVLERAVKAAPKSREAWNNLGTAAAELGQTQRAWDAFRQALSLDANYADGWFNLALLFEQAGRTREAIAAWDSYLRLDGKSGWADVARSSRERLAK
jgi:predicted Zn-dependent protease